MGETSSLDYSSYEAARHGSLELSLNFVEYFLGR